jgi:HPt (histidine-containing phosphotransfer) domain-containing protein
MAAAALRRIDDETGSAALRRADPACPIDLVHLARQTMGDRSLEVELLALFDRQAGKIAAQLSGLDGHEGQGWRVELAHKLKGSARAVGAFAVAAAAENYEHCARAGVLQPMDASRLVEAVAEVRAALRDLAG